MAITSKSNSKRVEILVLRPFLYDGEIQQPGQEIEVEYIFYCEMKAAGRAVLAEEKPGKAMPEAGAGNQSRIDISLRDEIRRAAAVLAEKRAGKAMPEAGAKTAKKTAQKE